LGAADALAKELRRTRSWVIREALTRYLAKLADPSARRSLSLVLGASRAGKGGAR
jgi:predicted transcriptional regulator